MRLRRRMIGGTPVSELKLGESWKRIGGYPNPPAELDIDALTAAEDLLPFLQLDATSRAALIDAAEKFPDAEAEAYPFLLPVIPRSFRDFMLYEKHVVDASRGMVRRLMPKTYPITRAFEALTGKPFPKFKPHPLWYRQPIYYFSNHNTIVTDGDVMPWPGYSDLLDYELELGAILAHPLQNASAAEAEAAIGGFVVLNDFSARDVQIDEMRSGFGPQKAKHFASAISAEIVTADEVLPVLGSLRGAVRINGKEVAIVSSAGAQFTLPEAIAFASRAEQLSPGELFGTGTIPGGTGIENDAMVRSGDTLTLTLAGVGSLTNRVGMKGD